MLTTDPARIVEYQGTPDQTSVTEDKVIQMIGQPVEICCQYTGIGEVTAVWEDEEGMTISNMAPYTITDPASQTAPDFTDFGVTCISFVMTDTTAQNYTCVTSNDVINPPGQTATITACLIGGRHKWICFVYVVIGELPMNIVLNYYEEVEIVSPNICSVE